MQTARETAAGASLPDGSVLIAGGYNSTDGHLSSAEIYSPSSNRFLTTGSMIKPRDGAVAVPLPNGKVLVGGGQYPLDTAELFVPRPEVSSSGGSFGKQTKAWPSASQTVTVTNLGAQSLVIGAVSLGGSNPGDFTITSDHCSVTRLQFRQSCRISVSFTPSALGSRSAALQLTDNEPTASSIVLSGTGVAPNSGPRGPRGPAGKIELVKCKLVHRTINVHGHKRRVTRQKCTARLVSGKVKFTAKKARALLTRAGRTYATGRLAHGRLVLHSRRRLHHGRYTLILRHRHHHHWVTVRRHITVA